MQTKLKLLRPNISLVGNELVKGGSQRAKPTVDIEGTKLGRQQNDLATFED